MVAKKSVSKTVGGIELYLRKIFGLMTGAVGVTALTTFIMIVSGAWTALISKGGLSVTYYIIAFGGLGLSLWAQARAFYMKPATAKILLFLYSIMMGIVLTPMCFMAAATNPLSIIIALVLAAIMFACMALFGYKTAKDLSFLGIFLFLGMIGLLLVGIVSMFTGPMGVVFNQIVCLIGVLVFALFAAYDMQTLKNAYYAVGNGEQKDQLAVLGALHMYISFVAMFEYILSLLNSRD